MHEIAKTQQRTRSYWFSDGIAEMVGGLAMALVGLPMIAAARTGMETLSTVALLGMILLFPLSARVVRYLKDRITHQRTGYVKYPRPVVDEQAAESALGGGPRRRQHRDHPISDARE